MIERIIAKDCFAILPSSYVPTTSQARTLRLHTATCLLLNIAIGTAYCLPETAN